jgi:hypothetical protein
MCTTHPITAMSLSVLSVFNVICDSSKKFPTAFGIGVLITKPTTFSLFLYLCAEMADHDGRAV